MFTIKRRDIYKKIVTLCLVFSLLAFISISNTFALDQSNALLSQEDSNNLTSYTVLESQKETIIEGDNKNRVTEIKDYDIISNQNLARASSGSRNNNGDLIGSSINVKLYIKYSISTLNNIEHYKLTQYKCTITMLDNTFTYKKGIHTIINKGLNAKTGEDVNNKYSTTTASKSFTYYTPSTWKYVNSQLLHSVGGNVKVYISRGGTTYNTSLSAYQ